MKIITKELDFLPSTDLSRICPPEEMLFFDIETTGLRKETTQLYLIGCAYVQNGTWYVRQWLTENLSDEYYVLTDFLSFASSFRTLVHFNGERFDIPYLQYKCEYYETDTDLSGFSSYDLYRRARCARTLLGGCSLSQKSVEEMLGIRREDKLNGGLLIPVYYEYEKTGAPELEELLLLHNFDDMQGMLKILPVTAFGDLFDGGFTWESISESMGYLILEYHLAQALPVCAGVCLGFDKKGKLTVTEETSSPMVRIYAGDQLLQISIRILDGTGRLAMAPVSDYYYVPELDTVIHRDVAQYMDRSKLRKATAANCFVKKQGQFLPMLVEDGFKSFCLGENRKEQYIDREAFTTWLESSPEEKQLYLNNLAAKCLETIAVQ